MSTSISTSDKPPRMRKACTECHAAKVRCSGERSGCTRCQQTNLNCVFKLSMVGRTSKKRKRSGGNISTRRRHSSSTLDDQSRGSPITTIPGDTIHALLSDIPGQETARFVSPSTYFDKSDYGTIGYMDFSDEPSNWSWALPDGATHQQTPDDPSLLAVLHVRGKPDKPRSTYSEDSRITTEPSSTSNDGSSSSDDGSEPGKERMAQLVSLCRMTQSLETRLQSRSGSLDEVLKVNKSCLAELVKLIGGKHRDHVCRCSFIMITTCLDTMLVLFEDVVRSSGLDQIDGANNSEARVPSLQFGVFELDPQEQRIITSRILARELHSYRDVVRALNAEFRDPAADFFRKLMGQWCTSLASRLGQLLNTLGKPGASASDQSLFD